MKQEPISKQYPNHVTDGNVRRQGASRRTVLAVRPRGAIQQTGISVATPWDRAFLKQDSVVPRSCTFRAQHSSRRVLRQKHLGRDRVLS